MIEKPRHDASFIIDRLFRNVPGWEKALSEARDEMERIQLVYDALGTMPELEVSDETAPQSVIRHELALLLAVARPALGGRTGIEAIEHGDTLPIAALLTAFLLSARVERQEELIRDIELAVRQLQRGETVSAELVLARRAKRRAPPG